jgi:hypothetical protein
MLLVRVCRRGDDLTVVCLFDKIQASAVFLQLPTAILHGLHCGGCESSKLEQPLPCACAGFAVVLFDDAVVLARHRPPVSAMQSLTRLPYLFGVAVYAFEVRDGS